MTALLWLIGALFAAISAMFYLAEGQVLFFGICVALGIFCAIRMNDAT